MKLTKSMFIGKMYLNLKLLIKKYTPRHASGLIEELSNFYSCSVKIIIFRVKTLLENRHMESKNAALFKLPRKN